MLILESVFIGTLMSNAWKAISNNTCISLVKKISFGIIYSNARFPVTENIETNFMWNMKGKNALRSKQSLNHEIIILNIGPGQDYKTKQK